jgi:hypothetical protein
MQRLLRERTENIERRISFEEYNFKYQEQKQYDFKSINTHVGNCMAKTNFVLGHHEVQPPLF